MYKEVITVENKLGLHARPAALLVKTASKFPCHIELEKDGLKVNGKSIMGVMMLAAEKGSQITIIADGEKEEEAVKSIVELFKRKFDEE